jgi:hypothetical protein
MTAPARPIVIQTMWRTGGTYLAFALRDQNPVELFYEPLHEDYSRHTKATWDGFAALGTGAGRGHPTKSFHYLTDFPFLPGAGVRGHRSEFAFERFVLERGDEAPALAAYLGGLVEDAAAQGRRALFKFCRGFLRQPWLEATLDAVTVYLARSPAGMLASYGRIGPYFDSGYLRILKANRGEPIFAAVYEEIAGRHAAYAQADATAGDSLAGTVAPQTSRDLFLWFWALALACHAAPPILTLDAHALGAEPRASEAALRIHTGLGVDLADAAPLDDGEAGPLGFGRPDVFGPLLRQAVAARAPGFDAASVPPRLRRQLETLLAAG